MKVAVVGAGWAGMAAALGAARQGHAVTVFEAARTVGGRARALTVPAQDGTPLTLDNGQHILIGAYAECLRLMRSVGVAERDALLRMPLALPFADGTGLRLPDLPPPWDALVGIARARGWSWGERLALLRTAAAWRLGGFTCGPQSTVADLCAHLPARLQQEFIDPLCVSALNTPAAQSSGRVFLRVLRDSLFSGRGGSHLLLPRVDLGALLPEPAAQWLRAHGHTVHLGRRVAALQAAQPQPGWLLDGEAFDAVVLATTSTEAARLAGTAAATLPAQSPHGMALAAWAACAQALPFTAIATVYARHPAARGPVLPGPMVALRSGPGQPAQFVFDRQPLGGPAGLLAFVVSAFEGERSTLEAQVRQQAAEQLGLAPLEIVQTVVEKRATFACLPDLQRPALQPAPGLALWACGDYIDGPYPATLEGAVLSGTAAAQVLGSA
ncbi:hydroxysqualene dehydroxylase HpnE [Paracidovorax wautersii]|uniref:Squalene-associated FAD-dependent desaturase n=1 Tax=Paracidovorax wautersii TaxID=1177982 RepID=A0ABU1IC53_9BURK|nr:hydroxysqualene dehydroxylase HpnE [Paracidovorax wautersii]MDR6214811.1 squalene-associated FAD-dependent desaturase [Paracidovorax wautersii]